MKKFSFSLGNVLDFKNSTLDLLKNEHSKIISIVTQQKEKIRVLNQKYIECNNEFNEKKRLGISITEASTYEAYLRNAEEELREENIKLDNFKIQENEKRKEVVEMKIETSSIERLKEKKLEQYNKEVEKSEELFVNEFIIRSMLNSN